MRRRRESTDTFPCRELPEHQHASKMHGEENEILVSNVKELFAVHGSQKEGLFSP